MDLLVEKVCSIVKKVGKFQLDSQFQLFEVKEKVKKEFVTKVDEDSEQMLFESLQKLLPEAGFWGEEKGKKGNENLLWIVDPIDGTTNYLAGLEYFSISVALHSGPNCLLGVVYQPSRDRVWAMGEDGVFWIDGTMANCSRVKLAQSKPMSDHLVATGFPYRSGDLRQSFYRAADYCLNVSRGIRRFGSAALDLCLLAEGKFGAFFETDLQAYDVAAGLMFLNRLGYKVGSEHCSEYRLGESRLLVAASNDNFEEFSKEIISCYQCIRAQE